MSKIENNGPRLPKTGEGNKAIEVDQVGDGFVIMRVLGEYIKYGSRVVHGKTMKGEISRWSESQVHDPGTRRQYRNLEENARKQAFAILDGQAERKNQVIKATKNKRETDHRQRDLF